MPNPTESPAPPRALVGWRLLALAYDFFPMLALWFITAGVFTAIHRDAVRGGWLGLLEFAVMWLLAGAYAVASWRRGGQTLGMRAWRLRAVDMGRDPAELLGGVVLALEVERLDLGELCDFLNGCF